MYFVGAGGTFLQVFLALQFYPHTNCFELLFSILNLSPFLEADPQSKCTQDGSQEGTLALQVLQILVDCYAPSLSFRKTTHLFSSFNTGS